MADKDRPIPKRGQKKAVDKGPALLDLAQDQIMLYLGKEASDAPYTSEVEWVFGIPGVTRFKDRALDYNAMLRIKEELVKVSYQILDHPESLVARKPLAQTCAVGRKQSRIEIDVETKHSANMQSELAQAAEASKRKGSKDRALVRKSSKEILHDRNGTLQDLLVDMEHADGTPMTDTDFGLEFVDSINDCVDILTDVMKDAIEKDSDEETDHESKDVAKPKAVSGVKGKLTGALKRMKKKVGLLQEIAADGKKFIDAAEDFALRLKAEAEDKKTYKREISFQSTNPVDEPQMQPLRNAFWGAYHVPNSRQDFQILTKVNEDVSLGEWDSPRLNRQYNLKGAAFAMHDPRRRRINAVSDITDALEARKIPDQHALAESAKRWKEDDRQGKRRMTRVLTSGSEVGELLQYSRQTKSADNSPGGIGSSGSSPSDRLSPSDRSPSVRTTVRISESVDVGSPGSERRRSSGGDLGFRNPQNTRISRIQQHGKRRSIAAKNFKDTKTLQKAVQKYNLFEYMEAEDSTVETLDVYRQGRHNRPAGQPEKHTIMRKRAHTNAYKRELKDTSLSEGIASKIAIALFKKDLQVQEERNAKFAEKRNDYKEQLALQDAAEAAQPTQSPSNAAGGAGAVQAVEPSAAAGQAASGGNSSSADGSRTTISRPSSVLRMISFVFENDDYSDDARDIEAEMREADEKYRNNDPETPNMVQDGFVSGATDMGGDEQRVAVKNTGNRPQTAHTQCDTGNQRPDGFHKKAKAMQSMSAKKMVIPATSHDDASTILGNSTRPSTAGSTRSSSSVGFFPHFSEFKENVKFLTKQGMIHNKVRGKDHRLSWMSYSKAEQLVQPKGEAAASDYMKQRTKMAEIKQKLEAEKRTDKLSKPAQDKDFYVRYYTWKQSEAEKAAAERAEHGGKIVNKHYLTPEEQKAKNEAKYFEGSSFQKLGANDYKDTLEGDEDGVYGNQHPTRGLVEAAGTNLPDHRSMMMPGVENTDSTPDIENPVLAEAARTAGMLGEIVMPDATDILVPVDELKVGKTLMKHEVLGDRPVKQGEKVFLGPQYSKFGKPPKSDSKLDKMLDHYADKLKKNSPQSERGSVVKGMYGVTASAKVGRLTIGSMKSLKAGKDNVDFRDEKNRRDPTAIVQTLNKDAWAARQNLDTGANVELGTMAAQFDKTGSVSPVEKYRDVDITRPRTSLPQYKKGGNMRTSIDMDPEYQAVLQQVAGGVLNDEEGQRIQHMMEEQARKARLDPKWLRTDLLDPKTFRKIPGGFIDEDNPSLVGYIHQRKPMSVSDVQERVDDEARKAAERNKRTGVLTVGTFIKSRRKAKFPTIDSKGEFHFEDNIPTHKAKGTEENLERPLTAVELYDIHANRVRNPKGASQGLDLQDKLVQECSNYEKACMIAGIKDYRSDKRGRIADYLRGLPTYRLDTTTMRVVDRRDPKEILTAIAKLGDKTSLFVSAANSFPQNFAQAMGTDKPHIKRYHEVDPLGTQIYAEICDLSKTVPRTKQVREPDRTRLEAADDELLDDDLLNLSIMMQKRPMVYIDLSGNRLLSDVSLIGLLRKLTSKNAASVSTLKVFKIKDCSRLSDLGISMFKGALAKFEGLREVCLSGLKCMTTHTLLDLSRILGNRPVRVVELADIGMPQILANRVLAHILENDNLEKLDVSWNVFDFRIFSRLRNTFIAIGSSTRLKCLNLSNTASAVEARADLPNKGLDHNPMNIFLEGVRDYEFEELDLSNNRLTAKSAVVLEASLYDNTTLKQINMENNPFGAEGCRSMLRCLALNSRLEHIGMHSMASAGGAVPIGDQEDHKKEKEAFLAAKIDKKAAAAAAEALRKEKAKHPHALPERIVMDPQTAGGIGVNYQLYAFLHSNPQRMYTLDLRDSGERAVMHLLVRIYDKLGTCDFIGLRQSIWSDTFVRDSKGQFRIILPTPGTKEELRFNYIISFSFKVDMPVSKNSTTSTTKGAKMALSAVEQKRQTPAGDCFKDHVGENETEDASVKMLQTTLEVSRINCTFDTEVRFINLWIDLAREIRDAEVMLDALSRDFHLSYRMVSAMIRYTPIMRHRIIFQTFGSLNGGRKIQKVLFLLEAPTTSDVVKINVYAKKLLNFCPENPSGHYILELDSLCDYNVADNMMKIDAWEQKILKANERDCKHSMPNLIVSQHGTPSNFRNETINSHPFELNATFQLPMHTTLEFDYASTRRPPTNAETLSDAQVVAIVRAFIVSNCGLRDLKDVLLLISARCYFTCRQTRRILNLFVGMPQMLIDLIVFLAPRNADWYLNEKIVRAMVPHLHWAETYKKRFGAMNIFPYVQPENYEFILDFRYWEDRLALYVLFSYDDNEKGKNLDEYTWDKDHDGKDDLLTSGIPKLWQREFPSQGLLRVTYRNAPEFTNMPHRFKQCATWGCWNIRDSHEEDESKLEWWMTIQEAPVYLAEMALLFLQEFNTLAAAFRYFDVLKQNHITRTNMRELFLKFAPGSPQDKIDHCFRFLDRGGEGTISWVEFKVFNDLWNEMFLGLEEFLFWLQLKISCETVAAHRGYLRSQRDLSLKERDPKKMSYMAAMRQTMLAGTSTGMTRRRGTLSGDGGASLLEQVGVMDKQKRVSGVGAILPRISRRSSDDSIRNILGTTTGAGGGVLKNGSATGDNFEPSENDAKSEKSEKAMIVKMKAESRYSDTDVEEPLDSIERLASEEPDYQLEQLVGFEPKRGADDRASTGSVASEDKTSPPAGVAAAQDQPPPRASANQDLGKMKSVGKAKPGGVVAKGKAKASAVAGHHGGAGHPLGHSAHAHPPGHRLHGHHPHGRYPAGHHRKLSFVIPNKVLDRKAKAIDLLPVTAFLDETFELCDLEHVWHVLDKDGSGTISMEEFLQAIVKYRYDRPNNDIIYSFLEASGDEISKEQFLLGLRVLMAKTQYNHEVGGAERKNPTVPKVVQHKKKESSFEQKGEPRAGAAAAAAEGAELVIESDDEREELRFQTAAVVSRASARHSQHGVQHAVSHRTSHVGHHAHAAPKEAWWREIEPTKELMARFAVHPEIESECSDSDGEATSGRVQVPNEVYPYAGVSMRQGRKEIRLKGEWSANSPQHGQHGPGHVGHQPTIHAGR